MDDVDVDRKDSEFERDCTPPNYTRRKKLVVDRDTDHELVIECSDDIFMKCNTTMTVLGNVTSHSQIENLKDQKHDLQMKILTLQAQLRQLQHKHVHEQETVNVMDVLLSDKEIEWTSTSGDVDQCIAQHAHDDQCPSMSCIFRAFDTEVAADLLLNVCNYVVTELEQRSRSKRKWHKKTEISRAVSQKIRNGQFIGADKNVRDSFKIYQYFNSTIGTTYKYWLRLALDVVPNVMKGYLNKKAATKMISLGDMNPAARAKAFEQFFVLDLNSSIDI